MVKQTIKFTADTGNTFDNEYDAWKDELRAWLIAHGADNDAIARKIVGAIDDGQPETLDALAQIVSGLKNAAPLPVMPLVPVIGDVT